MVRNNCDMIPSFWFDTSLLESYVNDKIDYLYCFLELYHHSYSTPFLPIFPYFLKTDSLVPTAHTGVIKLADFGVALRQSETVKNSKNVSKNYVRTCCSWLNRYWGHFETIFDNRSFLVPPPHHYLTLPLSPQHLHALPLVILFFIFPSYCLIILAS